MLLRTRTFALQRLAYSQPEAAEVLGVGLSHIKEALQNGELAEVEFDGHRRKLILHEDLQQYLLRHRVIRNGGDRTGKIPPAVTSLPAAPPTEKALTNRHRRGGLPRFRHNSGPPMRRAPLE